MVHWNNRRRGERETFKLSLATAEPPLSSHFSNNPIRVMLMHMILKRTEKILLVKMCTQHSTGYCGKMSEIFSIFYCNWNIVTTFLSNIAKYFIATHARTHTPTHTHTHNWRQLAPWNLWQPAPASFFYLQQDYHCHVWDINIADQPTC